MDANILTGEVVTIDGAQWLNHAGSFYDMLKDVTVMKNGIV